MRLYPAIDLKDNQCVRLKQGDYDRITVYSEDPAAVAKYWESEGAEYLHLVDLDAAKSGIATNVKAIKAIVEAVSIPVQLGGGIRSLAQAEWLFSTGVNRLILGTAAIEDETLLKALIKRFPGRIIVGVDALDGMMRTHGWTLQTTMPAKTFIQRMAALGITAVVYTDIAKDGMLSGPNFAMYEDVLSIEGIEIIASGGVSTLEDVKQLTSLGVPGAIIGKALYDNRFTLKEALTCSQKE